MDQGILDVIRSLSAQGETGKLQVTTGMTTGGFFFDKGHLVDARVGKLTGFQAVNAVVSIPDATFSFDPTIAPPVQSSITPNERLLLKDFFGIEAIERDDVHGNNGVTWPDDNATPERVVPLSEVASTSTLAAAQINEPLNANVDDEATLVRRNSQRPSAIPYQRSSTWGSRPALLVTALMLLLAAGAVFAIVYRARQQSAATSTATTAPTASPADVAPQAPASEQAVASAPDLTGNWRVTNTVEQTSYQAFRNMEVGFNLAIDQSGKEFTGRGQKVSENGRSLPATSRTPIELKGSIDGDKVEATFSESGAQRKTTGRFVWKIDKASGGLTGTFVSNAARASGKSAAKKQL